MRMLTVLHPHQLVEDQTTKMLVKFRRIMKNSDMMLYLVYHTNVRLSTSTVSDHCTLLLPIMHMRAVCVDVEQKNAKLNNRT